MTIICQECDEPFNACCKGETTCPKCAKAEMKMVLREIETEDQKFRQALQTQPNQYQLIL